MNTPEDKFLDDWTIEEFYALPILATHLGEFGECDSLVVLPAPESEAPHQDSFMRCIHFIPIKDHVPLGRIGGGLDCLDLTKGRFRIDCLKTSGLMKLFPADFRQEKIIVGDLYSDVSPTTTLR